MKQTITVEIEPEDGELCGDCRFCTARKSSAYCGAYREYLWALGDEAKRCEQCKATAKAMPDESEAGE